MLLSRSAQIFFQDLSLSPSYECFYFSPRLLLFSPRLYSLFPWSHDFLYHISSFWWNLFCRSFLSAYLQGKILRPLSISKYKCVYSTLMFYLFFNWLLAFSVAPEKLYVLWDPNSSFQKLIDSTLPHFILQRRQWHPTVVLLPGNSHGWRSLVGCSPWGCQELDMTEQLHFHFSLSCIGEGNGNPLQCSCLENPRDEGAWWAAVYGLAQSWTRLKRLSSNSSSISFYIKHFHSAC